MFPFHYEYERVPLSPRSAVSGGPGLQGCEWPVPGPVLCVPLHQPDTGQGQVRRTSGGHQDQGRQGRSPSTWF